MQDKDLREIAEIIIKDEDSDLKESFSASVYELTVKELKKDEHFFALVEDPLKI